MFKRPDRVVPSLLVLLMLFFLALGCGLDPYQLLPEQSLPEPTRERFRPAIEGRMIAQSSSAGVVWHRSDILVRRGIAEPLPGLLAGHSYVAFVNFLGGALSKINRLDVLDAETGATLWESERFSDYEAIAISQAKALVMLNEGSPLNIYSIQDGSEPVASFSYFKEATQFYLFPVVAEENIYIYYQHGNEYSVHSMNLEGQEVVQPRDIQVSGQPDLFLFNGQFFLMIGEGQYIGANLETGEELWRVPMPGGEWRISSWPVLKDDTLIIPAGDGMRYLLMAVDAQTGNKLWETEKAFGPSVVLHRDGLYALRNDAMLVKLDFNTGQVEEEIPFEPASINPGKWAYWLASDGERLFVYFGDSQELFALKTLE
jgi:outer membrane protein assembly factor BamB